MEEYLGICGTIAFMIGLGMFCGGEPELGIMLIIFGVFMVWSSVNKPQDNSSDNTNNTNKTNTYVSNIQKNDNDSNLSFLEHFSRTYDNKNYKKYVMVRFNTSSKVYTYLSNPKYPLSTGEYVNIMGNSGTEMVYVVKEDTLLPEKTDMHYKIIQIVNDYSDNQKHNYEDYDYYNDYDD